MNWKKFMRQWVLGEFTVTRFARSALLIYAILLIYGVVFSERMIFRPHPSSYQDDKGIRKLTTRDGTVISAMWIPLPSAKYTILFSHGNAEDLGDNPATFDRLRRLGFSVFAYDYHGYGTSQGTPSEDGAYQDIDAAYDELTGPLGIPPERIIAYGRSLGGGPSTDLASRHRIGGLILESTFVTAFRVVTRWPILPFDRFRNLRKVAKVTCPVLVMHGTADMVIPFWHGTELFAAAPGPKLNLWVEGAGHMDVMWLAPERYTSTIRQFVALLDKQSAPAER